MWTGTSILIAALLTGMLLSVNNSAIGLPYLLCFMIASLVVTAVVEARGLFVTVAQLPLLFGLFTPLTGWLVNRSNAGSQVNPFSKTMLLSSVFPLAQYFPQLIVTVVVCIGVACWRYFAARRKAQVMVRRFDEDRAEQARADRQNRSTATRVREMSERTRRARYRTADESQLTVDELVRNAEAKRAARAKRQERIHGSRGKAVPPRREPGESVKDMPSVEVSPRPAPKPAPKPKKRLNRHSLDDDLYS